MLTASMLYDKMAFFVGMTKLDVDDDASNIIVHAYQSCLLHSSPVKF